jgi:hypothetical protein
VASKESLPPTVLDLDVITWRYTALIAAGYPVDCAVLLAERADVDLREAERLIARGATPEQAVRILS